MKNGPTASYLDGDRNGRLHLQHGPIDLVIGVDGAISLELEAYFRAHAFAHANRRFQTILDELVSELPLLKAQARPDSPRPLEATARRMMAAVAPFCEARFITPMAAVAGAVADEVLAAMLAGFPADQRPRRIYVNNGGDIALHLEASAEFRVGMSREDGTALGAFAVGGDSATRGVATSGRGGRSLSMGIADSVTVLAASAAAADAAATMIANAVDLPGHAAILRAPACQLVDDSDLGTHLVVTGCGELSGDEIVSALDAGGREAEQAIAAGHIHKAGLFLRDRARIADAVAGQGATIDTLETRLYA